MGSNLWNLFTIPGFRRSEHQGRRFRSHLSQADRKGSMPGQSGIVMDLDGDGNQDLIIGAPTLVKMRHTGSLLVYFGASSGNFLARRTTVIRGDGNLGWSLTALGTRQFAAGAFSGGSQDVSLAGTVSIYDYGHDRKRVKRVVSGENALDKFGYVLASGDLNGDGSPDLVVGAPFHSPDPALYQKGAVYVYFGPNYDRPDR